jgi:hypothetical protein
MLHWLMREFSPETIASEVQDIVTERVVDAVIVASRADIRLALDNLMELYASDISLGELANEITPMNDALHDSLADQVEHQREDDELDDRGGAAVADLP